MSLFERRRIVVSFPRTPRVFHDALDYSNGLYTLCGKQVTATAARLDDVQANCARCADAQTSIRELAQL
jgi:hypothetical protein